MGPPQSPRLLGMDIIMCLTCGLKWTHGAWPDHGGQEASEHKRSEPNHNVVVGEARKLTQLFKEK